MKVDVYRSALDRDLFIYVPANTVLARLPLPEQQIPNFVRVESIQESIDIQPGDGRLGADSAAVISEINANGFSIWTDLIKVTRQGLSS